MRNGIVLRVFGVLEEIDFDWRGWVGYVVDAHVDNVVFVPTEEVAFIIRYPVRMGVYAADLVGLTEKRRQSTSGPRCPDVGDVPNSLAPPSAVGYHPQVASIDVLDDSAVMAVSATSRCVEEIFWIHRVCGEVVHTTSVAGVGSVQEEETTGHIDGMGEACHAEIFEKKEKEAV